MRRVVLVAGLSCFVFACLVFAKNLTFAEVPPNPSIPEKPETTAAPWKALLAAQAEGATKSNKRQYALDCKLSNGKSLFGKNRTTIADPRLIITESEPATLQRLSQSSFVTSVIVVGDNEDQSKNAFQPVITVLEEGFTLEATITPVTDNLALLDASLTLQKVGEVEVVEQEHFSTQAPGHQKIARRILRVVRLGEKQTVEVATTGKDKAMTFEYTVIAIAK